MLKSRSAFGRKRKSTPLIAAFTSSPRPKGAVIGTEAAATVRNAKAGNREAALYALLLFCEAVERGDDVPLEILVWLRKAFRKYLGQRKLLLNELLRLPPTPEGAQPNPSLAERNRRIARRVNLLYRRGKRKKAAMLTAAEEFKLSPSAIEKVMKEWRANLQDARDDRAAKKRALDRLFPMEKKALSE